MTSALQDFQQFVHWLHRPELRASEDARRFANMILANFPAIAASSRQRSQRSSVLSEFARRLLLGVSPDQPAAQAVEARADWPFRKLHHLIVGPFRGFRHPEPFELQKRIVMFYGPNGSGKTSLCEALEFALLGTVDEGGHQADCSRPLSFQLARGPFCPASFTGDQFRRPASTGNG